MERNEADSEDSFDDLRSQLPHYQSEYQPGQRQTQSNISDESLQTWEINRFNRTGPIPISELIKKSMHYITHYIKFYTLTYLIDLLIILILQYYGFNITKNIIHSLFETFSFAYLMSFRSNFTFSLACAKSITLSGLVCFIYFAIGNSITGLIQYFLKVRSSTTVSWVVLSTIYEISLFYLPCLAFDQKHVSIPKIFLFSFQIQLQINVLTSSILVFLCCKAASLLAPFTFGLSFWMGTIMRVLFFEAVCGSAISNARLPNV